MNRFFSFAEETASLIPDEYAHLKDAYVPKVSLMMTIISMIAILIAMVLIIVFVRKRQKGAVSGFFGGMATYLVFNYFAVNTLTNLTAMVIKNKVLISITAGIIAGLVIVFGRLLTTKAFYIRYKTIADILAFGVGIMAVKAIVAAIPFFTTFIACSTLDSSGVEALLSTEMSADDITAMLKTVEEMVNYNYLELAMTAFTAIITMIYFVALTVPLLAAYQNKVKKLWYGISTFATAVIMMFYYMYVVGVLNGMSQLILTALVAVPMIYLCIKMYSIHYKSEEYKEQQKAANAAKKMPKFDNLSKL